MKIKSLGSVKKNTKTTRLYFVLSSLATCKDEPSSLTNDNDNGIFHITQQAFLAQVVAKDGNDACLYEAITV